MTTALIISIFMGAYYAIGSYIAFRVFDPKTIGGFLAVYLFLWIFAPLVRASVYIDQFLAIRVRK